MKKTLITVIITLIAVALLAFIANSIWGNGSCIFTQEEEKKECVKEEKKACCDKKDSEDRHAKMMESLKPARKAFEAELSEEEKVVISGIMEKFGDVDHSKMCPEGEEKFMQEYKEDFKALLLIAENHKAYFDELIAGMHKEGCCKHQDKKKAEAGGHHAAGGGTEGEVKSGDISKCPEASKCKDATAKCKGEKTEAGEKECKEKADKECKEAKTKCEQKCLNTFKIHFLLLEY